MKLIKAILFGLSIGLLFFVTRCAKYDDDCDPDVYCDTVPYDSGYINIQANFKGNGIPIIVYQGYAEAENILFYDTMWSEEYSYYLPLGNRYAVEAFYFDLNNTIIALDGAKLKEESFWNCEEECHELAEITLDVKKL